MPKVQSYRQYNFTGKLYNYTITTDASGGQTKTFFYVRDIELSVAQNLFGRIKLLFKEGDSDILPEANIEDLRDKNGNEIYPNGVWSLQGVVPVINVYGVREGFRADAKLTAVTG